jgi:hypothetical protein
MKSSIADPDPDPGTGIRVNIQERFSESLKIVFWIKNADPDPGSF